jgi:putative membrane protein
MEGREQPPASPVASPEPGGRRRGASRLGLAWVIERTLLAWVRTGLAVMAFGGFLVRYGLRQTGERHADRQVGAALLLVGGAICALGAMRYLAVRRALTRNEVPVADPRLPVAIAFTVAAVAVLLVMLLWPQLVE